MGRLISSIVLAIVTVVLPLLASADEIVSPNMLYLRVAAAPSAIVTAYELPARGGLTTALSALCLRGGRGDVILAGEQFIIGSSVKRTVDEAQATLTGSRCAVRRATVPLHLKLVALGGGETYLADRNFGRSATIIRLDTLADRNLIAATLRNQPGSNGSLSTVKGLSLAIEAKVIADSSGTLDVESESFGADNVVYDAILAAAQTHRRVRLIVVENESQRPALDALARAGVQIRTGRSDAKLAIAQQGDFYIGSSNATAGYPDQIDWGKRLNDPNIRGTIAQRFNSDWNDASPL